MQRLSFYPYMFIRIKLLSISSSIVLSLYHVPRKGSSGDTYPSSSYSSSSSSAPSSSCSSASPSLGFLGCSWIASYSMSIASSSNFSWLINSYCLVASWFNFALWTRDCSRPRVASFDDIIIVICFTRRRNNCALKPCNIEWWHHSTKIVNTFIF